MGFFVFMIILKVCNRIPLIPAYTQNDPNGFYIINRLPYTQETEAALNITFANHYPEQIQHRLN